MRPTASIDLEDARGIRAGERMPIVHRIRRRGRRVFAIWIALYTLVVILPLPLGLIDLAPGRGFWINFSVALGFVGLSMFGLQFVMAARSQIVTQPVGMDLVLGAHRQLAFVATLFVFAHPIILFVLDARFLPLLDVTTSPWRAKFAVASLVLLVVLILLSVFRQRLRMSYAIWQATHAILAVAVVVTALTHVLLVDYYVQQWWERVLWIALSAAFVALGVWVRIVKPLMRRRRRFVVEAIEHEVGDVTTVTIRPADPTAWRLRPFHFEAGQFAWLQARRSPFDLTYHPFSFASSAERPDRIVFAIKAHERFTRDIAELVPGDSVYLDGPFGAFTLPEHGPLVGIAAGVGITPLLSMFETVADRADGRECVLWLGNRDERSIAAGARIDALVARMNLRVVHVLSRPSPGWAGAVGHLDAAFVAANLPEAPAGATFCICGPNAMMDEVEHALASSGVAHDAIASERFGMV